MKEITHRQMRNESAEILRRVEAGESILVTNHGRPAAVIVPPGGDVLARLTDLGQVRVATAPVDSLLSISRRPSRKPTSEIVRDSRGRW